MDFCIKIFFRKIYILFESVFNDMESDRPLDALNSARNKRVIVELKNQKQFIGKIKAFDIHINVVLEDAEEYVDGQLRKKMGTAFIRGDTIVYIAIAD